MALLEDLVQNVPEDKDERLRLLKELFPNREEIYLKAIAEELEPKDWPILKGVQETPEFLEARRRLEMTGLSNYDKPGEIIGRYTSKGKKEEKKEIDYTFLKSVIKDLLGFYNEKGKFILGGIAQTYLKADNLLKEEGKTANIAKAENVSKRKKQAIKIYETYKSTIDAIMNDNISVNSAKYFIDQLGNEHLEKKDKAAQRIKEAYKAIPTDALLEGEVVARVWKRDPLVDMSYTDIELNGEDKNEFYCCAFLGGGNDSAAPEYLKNGVISMLDFDTVKDGKEKRLVRAITGAAVQREKEGLERYMLVDSVEGTDSVSNEIVFDAIVTYAKKSGFDNIIFSNDAGNRRAGKFIEYLGKEKKLKEKTVKMQLLYTNGVDYLEGFGGFTFCAGGVEGYVYNLKGERK